MTSVFKKLISKELGESKYNKYFFNYQKLITDKSFDVKRLDNKEIYEDIYENLKDRDIIDLTKMLERLLDAMYVALHISKRFLFIFLFYFISVVFLITQGLLPIVTVAGILLISGCFLYKTYEFVVNKYCYIDAHIILVYKSVLDKLIVSYDNNKDRLY